MMFYFCSVANLFLSVIKDFGKVILGDDILDEIKSNTMNISYVIIIIICVCVLTSGWIRTAP